MSLINSTYFNGKNNIPNNTYVDVVSQIDSLINFYEREYLETALGYELYTVFQDGLLDLVPEQRLVDILMGKEFIGLDGRLKRWRGLVSLVEPTATISVTFPVASNDTFFTVGVGAGPIAGTSTYSNPYLAGKNYKVSQRGFGLLEPLESDESNVGTADYVVNPGGGFSLLNGINFSLSDKYIVQLASAQIDVSGYEVVPEPESPIADYVYYWYLRKKVNHASGTGQVQAKNENSTVVTSVRQQAEAYNNMVDKTLLLVEMLQSDYSTYPEFIRYAGTSALWRFLRKINPYNF